MKNEFQTFFSAVSWFLSSPFSNKFVNSTNFFLMTLPGLVDLIGTNMARVVATSLLFCVTVTSVLSAIPKHNFQKIPDSTVIKLPRPFQEYTKPFEYVSIPKQPEYNENYDPTHLKRFLEDRIKWEAQKCSQCAEELKKAADILMRDNLLIGLEGQKFPASTSDVTIDDENLIDDGNMDSIDDESGNLALENILTVEDAKRMEISENGGEDERAEIKRICNLS